jgi:anti-sigma factor RsiW
MNSGHDVPLAPPGCCSGSFEEAMNLFVDGELPFDRQPALFAHLVACDDCRRMMDSVMRFRRISRQEHLAVPTAVDDLFMKRLAHQKETSLRVDRAADRSPLWHARTPVSLRTAAAVAAVVFVVGLLLPAKRPSAPPANLVNGLQERVEFLDRQASPLLREAVYVFYPGLTVEATKGEDVPVVEPM